MPTSLDSKTQKINLHQISEEANKKDVGVLEQIRTLTEELKKLEVDASELNDELEENEARQLDISKKLLPSLMAEAKITSFRCEDGSEVAGKDLCFGHMPNAETAAEDYKKCLAYLQEKGAQAMLKQVITVDKGQDAKKLSSLNACLSKLTDTGFSASVKETIHPATLNTFIREQIVLDPEFPKTIFSVFEESVVEIKAPRMKLK